MNWNTTMKRRQPRSDEQRNPVLRMVRDVRGTATRIADACSINREAVWNWHQVPPKHVLTIEQLLDIPRHRIRPDLYPPPSHASTKRWLTNNGRKQHGARA
jgi:pyruvate kinase